MKDAYYFPHDSNAKDDPKCIQLIEEQGVEGYGIFWILIETLRSQNDYRAPISILTGLARRYNTTAEKMRNVVLKYDLFKVTKDDCFFFSESFTRRMQLIDAKRKKLSEAGKKGNSIRWESPPNRLAIATQSQVKESKGKESKEKERKEKSVELTSQVLDAREISEHLLSRIIEWQPDHKYTRNKPSTEAWVQDIDRAMRIDGIPKENLMAMIDYVFTRNTSVSQFWAPNIQSGAKVRKHFEAIRAQATTENKKHKNNNEKSIIDHEQLLSDVLEVSRQLQNS